MIRSSLANFNHLEAGMGLHGHQGSSGRVEVADRAAYYRADVPVLLFNISKTYKHHININILKYIALRCADPRVRYI